MYIKKVLFFCFFVFVAFFLHEIIRIALKRRKEELKKHILGHYNVRNNVLFEEWIAQLSWCEVSSYRRKLNGFRVPDEVSAFLSSAL